MNPVDQPHLVKTEAITVAGETPRERGLARASQVAPRVRAAVRAYEGMFERYGLSDMAKKKAARASLDALRDWDPAQFEEVSGIAMGAGLHPPQ